MITKFLILILWFFSTIKTILFHAYFWQLKEYRLDRIMPHLKLKTGRKMIFSPSSLTKWALILLLFLAPIEIKGWLLLLVPIVFLVEFFDILKRFLARELYHPKFTLRAGEIIFGVLLLFILGVAWLFLKDVRLWIFALSLLFLERLITLIVPLQVFLTKLPSFIGKEMKIRKAKEKLKQIKNLKVIGVTGSYGKTSTKDFIAHFLAKRYKVARTQVTNNTKIGIAQNILSELKNDTEVFVVEMGAYKKKEIAEICCLIQPDISVVTGINEQHLAIFGNLDNLIEAKYEIIEALSSNGVVVFNGNNRYCLKMAQKASKKYKTIVYQKGKPKSKRVKSLIWADMIKEKKDKTSFKVHFNQTQINLETNLVGQHNIDNILAAIAVARELGLNNKQITERVNSLLPSGRAMKVTKGINNITFINDTFSSNPHGFLAAINYLKKFESKTKIIITPGMIELGSASGRIHQKIGEEMRKVVDLVILTNDNFLNEIKTGMGKEKTKAIFKNQPDGIISILKEKSPGVIVLLEGRLPAKIINSLKLK